MCHHNHFWHNNCEQLKKVATLSVFRGKPSLLYLLPTRRTSQYGFIVLLVNDHGFYNLLRLGIILANDCKSLCVLPTFIMLAEMLPSDIEYSGRSLKSIFCFLIEARGSFRSMQSELHEKLKVTRNCTHHDRKGFRAATAKMMRLMTIMVEATVTAKTGTKLSQEAQSVSPLPPRNETAKTSAQALLFLRVSFRHWTLSTSFILRPGLAFSAASSFSTKSH